MRVLVAAVASVCGTGGSRAGVVEQLVVVAVAMLQDRGSSSIAQNVTPDSYTRHNTTSLTNKHSDSADHH